MGVSHIDEIPLDDLPKAISYVHNLVYGSNRSFIQNILADNAHQNRKAQDELSQIIASIGHALEHVKEMQLRLGKQERLIGTLTAQL